MPSLSPHAPPTAASPSAAGSGGAMRPPLMRKQSSQSSHSGRQQQQANSIASPGSVSEHQHPLRHPVRSGRHAKIVLPRNHSSARNLAKLNGRQQVQYADDGRRHTRQRSHEGDTEIRLPGSLDESTSMKPPMRRNLTASQLPRNTSYAKLKKNYSHGQLSRLGSTKNLAALNSTAQRAPPSPGLKGKSKRPKSAEMPGIEDMALAQEADLQRRRPPAQRKNSVKKVGFAVGSAGDSSDADEALQMEGSGLQEDEWTEDSASASPYSTRQNTANNSRRASVVVDKTMDKPATENASRIQEYNARESALLKNRSSHQSEDDEEEDVDEEDDDEGEDDEDEDSDEQSALTMGSKSKTAVPMTSQSKTEPAQLPEAEKKQQPSEQRDALPKQPPPQRSPLHLAKEYANPTTQRLLDKNHQLPAPALVSNVSALDDTHSSRGSPAPSLRSSRSNMVEVGSEQQEDELVSRFVPSGSHPSLGSNPVTAMNTPKQTEFHTPEEDSTLARQGRERHTSGFHVGPVSPGSTVSGSSGATTPAIGRSRTELRMLQEKALADMESTADSRPQLPAHVYDRRNESLKYFLATGDNRLTSLGTSSIGPEVFQGRFRALNTELRVVQKFRDPIGEAVARLKGCKGGRLGQRPASQRSLAHSATLPMSKSAVNLPLARRSAADLSKSASPPKSSLQRGSSTVQVQAPPPKQRREVSFARAPPETRTFVPSEDELAPDVIAKRMWESLG